MRARYYHPMLRRFVSEDPLGIRGGLNVYAYANSDPINRSDPSGLCDIWLKGGIIGSVEGAACPSGNFGEECESSMSRQDCVNWATAKIMKFNDEMLFVGYLPVLGVGLRMAVGGMENGQLSFYELRGIEPGRCCNSSQTISHTFNRPLYGDLADYRWKTVGPMGDQALGSAAFLAAYLFEGHGYYLGCSNTFAKTVIQNMGLPVPSESDWRTSLTPRFDACTYSPQERDYCP